MVWQARHILEICSEEDVLMQWKNLQSYLNQMNKIASLEERGMVTEANKARLPPRLLCLPATAACLPQLLACLALPACLPQLPFATAACLPQLPARRSCGTAAASCDHRQVSEPKACWHWYHDRLLRQLRASVAGSYRGSDPSAHGCHQQGQPFRRRPSAIGKSWQ